MSLESKVAILQDRAAMLEKARSFFREKNILEVDCPALSKAAPIDLHIDVMAVTHTNGEKRYLHTSPEYRMKRLLSEGLHNIYQISHVFREGEYGDLHNPEFCMAEWYETGVPFQGIIDSTLAFIRLFIDEVPHKIISYRDALKKYLDFDYVSASPKEIAAICRKHDLSHPEMETWDKDTLLQYAMSFLVEPKLGIDELSVITHYPGTQAALAQTHMIDDEFIAERFEVYYQGIELANGYHELTNSTEQRDRFQKENNSRLRIGKNELPIDDYFLESLIKGIPDCCGVAVGFDRLMLLRHKKKSLRDILPFFWDNT